MKVLMISGDKTILEEGSIAHDRFLLQRGAVDQLDVFVWPQVHSGWAIYRAIRQVDYDVVTAQDPFWRGLLAWLLVRRSVGAKLNLQVHTELTEQSVVRRLLARFLLRRANSVRVVSERTREVLEQLNLRARVTVVPIFIDVERFRDVARHPHQHIEKTILWIGRFEAEKDPLAALSILRNVRATGMDVKLVYVGAGRLERLLRRKAGKFGEVVTFVGWKDPLPYLAHADVVVSTSLHESYGASIIEALAAGVPVVSPDYGIAREAGAVIAERERMADTVAGILASGERGVLKLRPPSADVWAERWRSSLV